MQILLALATLHSRLHLLASGLTLLTVLLGLIHCTSDQAKALLR